MTIHIPPQVISDIICLGLGMVMGWCIAMIQERMP